MYLNKSPVLCMDLLCLTELINFVGNLFARKAYFERQEEFHFIRSTDNTYM